MRKTNPGAERERYREVRTERLEAREAERRHKQHCPRCAQKGITPYQRCDAGWELAKRVHRAEYWYGRFMEETINGQGTLW